MKKILSSPIKIALLIGGAFLLGAIITTGVRFVIYKPDKVHYHANFQLWVNGVRDEFKGPAFYEEVAACHAPNTDDPHDRTHMHGNVNDVVHVHAHGVTWSQFFTNLNYTIGDNILVTGRGTYIDGANGNKLSFILNNQAVDSIANKVIGDEDVLLINYGPEPNKINKTLNDRYNNIARTAHQYDVGRDPATCAGADELTFWKRLKISLGANP